MATMTDPESWPTAKKLEIAEDLKGDPDGVMRNMIRHDVIFDELERALQSIGYHQCGRCEAFVPGAELARLPTDEPGQTALTCNRCAIEYGLR